MFRHFVVQANFPVIKESIEKRNPPEPDILCRLKDGNQVAFELVEVCHPQNVRFSAKSQIVGRLLEETYNSLPAELRQAFDSRFGGKPLSFAFHPEATTRQISTALPLIFSELINQWKGEEEYCTFSARTSKVLHSVKLRGHVYERDRPFFNIAGSFQSEEIVVQTIVSKLSKKYETPHPIELLAFIGAWAWGKSTGWQDALGPILQSQGLGPFRRVWVLGWDEVQFVYPEHF